MSSRFSTVVITSGALLVFLAACSVNEQTAPTGTPTSTTAPSSTAVETPAETPKSTSPDPVMAAPDPADYPEIHQQTETGAKSFYRYFWDSYAYANITGDTNVLEFLSGPACGWCEAVVTRIHEEGATWLNGGVEYSELVADMDSDPRAVYVQFTTTFTEKPVNDSAGSPSGRSITAHAISELQWSNGQWLVNSVDVETL